MEGLGTRISPFKVYTREDFSKISNNPEACYVQCKNINIKDIAIPHEFSGYYDGNDYLLITEKRTTPVFYSISHAVLRNISLLCKDGDSICVFSQRITKTHMLCTACVAKISASAYSQEKIYQWMNDTFYNTVFDEDMKELIICVRDKHKVILLGEYIASTCFNTNIERQASYIANPYRIKKDETNNTSGFLGLNRKHTNTSSSPSIGGTITSWNLKSGYRVNEGGAIEIGYSNGVRPAFWVSTKI